MLRQENIEIQVMLFKEKSKDYFEESFQSWNYSIHGSTIDKDDLRVIVSFEEKDLLIITAFYIEKRGH